jgi:hypothetical protein
MKNDAMQEIIIEPGGTIAGFQFRELCRVRFVDMHYPK